MFVRQCTAAVLSRHDSPPFEHVAHVNIGHDPDDHGTTHHGSRKCCISASGGPG